MIFASGGGAHRKPKLVCVPDYGDIISIPSAFKFDLKKLGDFCQLRLNYSLLKTSAAPKGEIICPEYGDIISTCFKFDLKFFR